MKNNFSIKQVANFLGVFILILSLCSFSDKPNKNDKKQKTKGENHAETNLMLDGKIKKLVLRSSNGCGIGNFIIPSTGNPTLNVKPTIGSVAYEWPNYNYAFFDTIPGRHIKGVAFKRGWWPDNTSIIDAIIPTEPYVVVSDAGMFSYLFDDNFSPDIGTFHKSDSLYILGILKMAKQITTDVNQPIVLLTSDSVSAYRIRFYSYPSLLEQFNVAFPVMPEIFEVTQNSLYVTAWDTSGIYKLYHYSTLMDTLYASYTLTNNASNAKEFLKSGDSLFILSTPGDSVTILTTLLASDSSLLENIVYAPSGARATYNEFQGTKKFTFQPIGTVLDKDILVLDPLTAQFTDTLMINLKLDWFKNPAPAYWGFGFFSMNWMGSRWENGINDSVFISDVYGDLTMRFSADAYPQYINATYGCWLRVAENELNEIKFEVHPNPATSEALISLKGLMKGHQYKLAITDISGNKLYTTMLEAYQEFEIPLDKFIPGVYILNLDTGKNIITKKLVIQ